MVTPLSHDHRQTSLGFMNLCLLVVARSRRKHAFIGAHPGRFAGRRFPLTALAISACSDAPTAPRPAESGTTVRWNAIARELVINDRTAPPMAARAYAYLSIAQYASALAARGIRPDAIPSLATLRDAHSPSAAAIATASAHLLVSMFPSQALRIEHELERRSERSAGAGNRTRRGRARRGDWRRHRGEPRGARAE